MNQPTQDINEIQFEESSWTSRLIQGISAFFQRRLDKLRDPAFIKQMVWSIGSIILALLIGAVVMTMSGYDTGLAFIVLLRGAIVQFDRVLFYATPLIFTGLSVALAFKCGLFNIGPEGQLYIGAMAAAIAGYMISLPIVIHPLVCLLFAGLAGFVWGFIPGLLKAYRGAHEVVTTMMITYATLLFTQWLVKQGGPFWDGSDINETPLILPTASISIPGSDFVHFGLIIGIVAVIAVDFLVNKTVLGYEMRAVGLNRDAAEYSGINAKKSIALSLGIAGFLAGIGGGGEILGYHQRFIDNWSSGLGWDGITVAVLGNNNPWGVLAGAIFFGALRTGGNAMQRIAGVPAEMVVLIQGLIVMLIAAPRIVDWFIKRGDEEVHDLRAEPMDSILHLLPMGFAIISSIMAFTMILTFAAISPWGSLVLLILGFTALDAFIQLLSRNESGKRALLVSSIGWFIIAAIGAMMLVSSTMSMGMILGLIGIVLLAMDRFLPAMIRTQDAQDNLQTESDIE
jgi:ABC-type uncharacterized transport system permease subunit